METYKTNKANIGDIINSEKFAFGYYDGAYDSRGYMHPDKNKAITIDGKTENYPMGYYNSKNRSWDREVLSVDLGAYNKSRAKANFVVEKTAMTGGGTGHGPNDVYPNGWHIVARRLSKDNSYNPLGELITFYQSGCFTCMVEEVNVVGKMQPMFVMLEQYTSLKK